MLANKYKQVSVGAAVLFHGKFMSYCFCPTVLLHEFAMVSILCRCLACVKVNKIAVDLAHIQIDHAALAAEDFFYSNRR